MRTPLPAWPERAQPAADILNPAISSVCVAWAAKRYERDTDGAALPFSLSFLVAPLVFHEPTRARLPQKVTSHFPTWVTHNAEVLAGFPRRAGALVPYVREGIRTGVRSGLITLDDAGDLTATIAAHTTIPSETELRSIATSSALVGGWFARAGTPANVFTQLGVAP